MNRQEQEQQPVVGLAGESPEILNSQQADVRNRLAEEKANVMKNPIDSKTQKRDQRLEDMN